MPVGDTVKLFVCWPPTEHNLKLLDDEPPGPERLSRIIDQLQGGRCVVVCRNNPLYLSSGCIHAVVTLRGGFMYAGNFMTANNGAAFIRALRFSPAFVDRYDDAGLRGLFANLLDQIYTTLGRLSCWHSLIAELIKSWPIIQRIGRKTEKKRLAERLLRLSKESQWQQVCAEFSDTDMAMLDDIVRAQLNRGVRSIQRSITSRPRRHTVRASSPVRT
jgi:hypothetical protein